MKRPEGFDSIRGTDASTPPRRTSFLRKRGPDALTGDGRDPQDGAGSRAGAPRAPEHSAVPILRIPGASVPPIAEHSVAPPGERVLGSIGERVVGPIGEHPVESIPAAPGPRPRPIESHTWGSVPWTPALRMDDRPGAGDSDDLADGDLPDDDHLGDDHLGDADPGEADFEFGDVSHRAIARDLRRAARARRRYERGEVKRYTRRHRQRRIAGGIAAALVLVLLGLVAVAVYSPLLALQSIRIEGTDRVPAGDVLDAVDGQLDTPLALLDLGLIKEQLGDFPLIRSYVTETIPPHTLVIHVTERQAIGALPDGDGVVMVDPAGIVVERRAARPDGMPLIDVGNAGTDGDAFDAVVAVLVSLPESVLGQVDSITATTPDDVRLRLVDQGAEITWGSPDESDYKARVLEKALTLDLAGVTEINVSAPGQLTLH